MMTKSKAWITLLALASLLAACGGGAEVHHQVSTSTTGQQLHPFFLDLFRSGCSPGDLLGRDYLSIESVLTSRFERTDRTISE